MGGVATLFKIKGIPVQVHVSWLVIVGLITWSLSVGYFPRALPELPTTAHWINGLVAALLLFVSVFLHELSHSVAALRFGIPVRAITLHIFGGVSQMEREPDRPGKEFVIAAVGPLTSFAIALVVSLASAVVALPPSAAAIATYLTVVNLIVGVFNLVPGFPLDGGRLLRAALWKLKGSMQWATRMATHAGTAFAFFLIAFGIVRALAGEFLGGLWLVLIGLFLRQAGQGSYQQLVLRRALSPLPVSEVMTREVVHLPAELSVARAVEEVFWRHHVSSFPVLDNGSLIGILSLRQVKQHPRERWAETTVRELMLPLTESLTITPRESLWEAMQKLSQNGLGRLAVVEQGRLLGYLSIKDALHILAVKEGLG